MSLIANGAGESAGFYNGVATQSLRFDEVSSATIKRTPSTAGNLRTWTWSAWIKRVDVSNTESIFEGGANAANTTILYFSGATLHLDGVASSSATFAFAPTQVFRDVSSWYHIVIAMDTTQATAGNRFKFYVNGSAVTDFATDNYPSRNLDTTINSEVAHGIGRRPFDTTLPSHSYMAEVNFVDGLALAPSNFGETKNGVWIAKAPNVSEYGTNGFRLKFDQVGVGSASTSTIGADTSGKTNHLTSTNIVASDCAMPDSPENNFSTMNPLHFRATYGMATMSEGNLAYGSTGLSNSWGVAFSTFNVTSGKWYAELLVKGSDSAYAGVLNVGHYGAAHFLIQNPFGATGNWALLMDGSNTVSRFNGNNGDPTYTAFNTDKVLGILLNADDKELSFTVDGTLQTGIGSSGVLDISTGGSSNDAWAFNAGTYNGSSSTFVWNYGQDSSFSGDETATSNSDANGNGTFHTAVPSGYLALCSANLEEPTIGPNSTTQADDHFNTALWTGNGGTQNITGVGFQPDWIWHKNRSNALTSGLTDSSRGLTKQLASNSTGADQNTDDGITAFGTDGFSLGAGTEQYSSNTDDHTYVAWNWKANGGTTVTNDASSTSVGDTDSVIQANTDAGFSIVTYTGFSGSSGTATVAHGLGVAPEIIIHKSRTRTSAWWTQAPKFLTNASHFLALNETATPYNLASYGTMSAPTSSVFSINGVDGVGGESANYIAYCFHSVEGYSKIGSVVGNGNADGAFVFTGFRPAFILVKCITATNDWFMYDTVRDTFNVVENILAANLANAESGVVTASRNMDILSNGFKARGSDGANLSTKTHIYIAFAEAPFKYANAR